MDRRRTAKDGPITNLDMAAKQHFVGKDDAVTHVAIVANVAADHEISTVANPR